MTSLITCLGEEKGTVAHVAKIIDEGNWDSVFVIAKSKPTELTFKQDVEFIIIDPNKLLPELVEEIMSKLKGKIADTEVALNIISGSGKEHMALLSAVLKSGLGIRLIALTKEGVKEI